MDVVIIYESLTGTTRRAAHLIGDGLFDHHIGSRVFPTSGVTDTAIAGADLVVIGTWTDGALVVGQRPGRARRLRALPDLTGKRCVVFCTYAIHPGRTLRKLSAIVESRGGEVVGGMTLRRDHLREDAAELVARVVDAVIPTVPSTGPVPDPGDAAPARIETAPAATGGDAAPTAAGGEPADHAPTP